MQQTTATTIQGRRSGLVHETPEQLKVRLRKRFKTYIANANKPFGLTFDDMLAQLKKGTNGYQIAKVGGESPHRIERVYNECFRQLFAGKSLGELRKEHTARRQFCFPADSAIASVAIRAKKFGCVALPTFTLGKYGNTTSRRYLTLNGKWYLVRVCSSRAPFFRPNIRRVNDVEGIVFVVIDDKKTRFYIRSLKSIWATRPDRKQLYIRARPQRGNKQQGENWKKFLDAWPKRKKKKR